MGVVGGAGYTAGELLPHNLQITLMWRIAFCAHSNSNAGNPITDVHSGLIGETNLVFYFELSFDKVDALFLCSRLHGDSKKFMDENNVPAAVKIIDLSTDYRKTH